MVTTCDWNKVKQCFLVTLDSNLDIVGLFYSNPSSVTNEKTCKTIENLVTCLRPALRDCGGNSKESVKPLRFLNQSPYNCDIVIDGLPSTLYDNYDNSSATNGTTDADEDNGARIGLWIGVAIIFIVVILGIIALLFICIRLRRSRDTAEPTSTQEADKTAKSPRSLRRWIPFQKKATPSSEVGGDEESSKTKATKSPRKKMSDAKKRRYCKVLMKDSLSWMDDLSYDTLCQINERQNDAIKRKKAAMKGNDDVLKDTKNESANEKGNKSLLGSLKKSGKGSASRTKVPIIPPVNQQPHTKEPILSSVNPQTPKHEGGIRKDFNSHAVKPQKTPSNSHVSEKSGQGNIANVNEPPKSKTCLCIPRKKNQDASSYRPYVDSRPSKLKNNSKNVQMSN